MASLEPSGGLIWPWNPAVRRVMLSQCMRNACCSLPIYHWVQLQLELHTSCWIGWFGSDIWVSSDQRLRNRPRDKSQWEKGEKQTCLAPKWELKPLERGDWTPSAKTWVLSCVYVYQKGLLNWGVIFENDARLRFWLSFQFTLNF